MSREGAGDGFGMGGQGGRAGGKAGKESVWKGKDGQGAREWKKPFRFPAGGARDCH